MHLFLLAILSSHKTMDSSFVHSIKVLFANEKLSHRFKQKKLRSNESCLMVYRKECNDFPILHPKDIHVVE